jgi:hypothetical protein
VISWLRGSDFASSARVGAAEMATMSAAVKAGIEVEMGMVVLLP